MPDTPRREDDRLLRGAGSFVQNLALPGMLHAVFVRSQVARGAIRSIDLEAARAAEGVALVLAGADLPGLKMPPINPMIDGARVPDWPALAQGRVSHVGQPVAMVVAASRRLAERAAQAVAVDIDLEDAVPDLGAGGTPVHAELPDGVVAELRLGQAAPERPGAVRASARIEQARVVAMTMEPRATAAHFDAAAGRLTVWLPSQSPSRAREEIARAFGLAVESVRVIAPDVGGAFGAKAALTPEDLLVAAAAMRLPAPVKWAATRWEDMSGGVHGRGGILEGELELDDAGRPARLRATLEFPLGAWLGFSALVPARNAARMLPGPYRIPEVEVVSRASVSNAASVAIYRGAGRPEAAMLMERLVDEAAARAGVDPVEFRRRCLVGPGEMPWRTATGETYDSGDYPRLLELACERFGYAQAREALAARRRAGEVAGIGVASYVEPCGRGWESARVTALADGSFVVASGSTAQGQGHETSYARIAANELGVPPERVRVVHGDTDACPPGIGAVASRSIAIGGSAVAEAARRLAARLRAGAALPASEESVYEAPAEAWSSGCVIAALAIDAETGEPRVERIAWADDAGRIVSPVLARGQLIGGLAQGIGQALLERIAYDESGQLLTASLMDYAVPRADQIPPVDIVSIETRTEANLLGAKGVGEAGCIGVPAAILNAAVDALAAAGVPRDALRTLSLPLRAEPLWRLLRQREENEIGV